MQGLQGSAAGLSGQGNQERCMDHESGMTRRICRAAVVCLKLPALDRSLPRHPRLHKPDTASSVAKAVPSEAKGKSTPQLDLLSIPEKGLQTPILQTTPPMAPSKATAQQSKLKQIYVPTVSTAVNTKPPSFSLHTLAPSEKPLNENSSSRLSAQPSPLGC